MRQDVGVDDTTPDGDIDDETYDSAFYYDSDDSCVTLGWASDDSSLSSDEGTPDANSSYARPPHPYQLETGICSLRFVLRCDRVRWSVVFILCHVRGCRQKSCVDLSFRPREQSHCTGIRLTPHASHASLEPPPALTRTRSPPTCFEYNPALRYPFAGDSGDEEDNDQNLPDLEYKSKNKVPPVFEVLEEPEDTWNKIYDDVKKALVNLGHNCATKVIGKERVRSDLQGWQSLGRIHNATPVAANYGVSRRWICPASTTT